MAIFNSYVKLPEGIFPSSIRRARPRSPCPSFDAMASSEGASRLRSPWRRRQLKSRNPVRGLCQKPSENPSEETIMVIKNGYQKWLLSIT